MAVHRPYNGPEDSFETTCAICGEPALLTRDRLAISETYPCPTCRGKLRFQGLARVVVDRFSRHGSESIAALVDEPEFHALHLYEPGELGPLRRHFRRLPNYEVSSYWPDAAPGEVRDGVRCEDMMQLTFPTNSFDLVITSDVFEHVRKPYVGFAELHRVLRPGGAHVFSIPVRWPMRDTTVERVDTSGADDVLLMEAAHHAGHLVYNDFGRDMLDRLDEIGFDTEPVVFASPSDAASQLVTFCSVKPQR